MDYLLKNKYLYSVSEVLDTVVQQAVDLDFTLPDYCADIEKILKCTLVPKIHTRYERGYYILGKGEILNSSFIILIIR